MINTEDWALFKISEIFNLEKGKCSNSPELNPGYDIPYVGAKKRENGIMRWVALDEESEKLVTKGNCIVFICQGAGSNGYNLYVDIDSIQTTSNFIGYNSNLNKYNALFIVTVLDLERPKWSFGRGRATKLKNTLIKLPYKEVDDKIEPNWNYMTSYMKNIFTEIKRMSNRDFE